jgi:hypothetical protein
MIKPLRHNRQRNTSLKQFRRHEMAEIMLMPTSA